MKPNLLNNGKTIEMKKINQIILILSLLLFISCNSEQDNKEGKNKPQTYEQSISEGKLTVYVDTLLTDLLEPIMGFYRESYPKIELNVNYINSRRAVALLFSGEAEVIVLSRNYLKDEDSLNKEFSLNRPEMVMAEDGLVFFTNNKFGLDTLNDEQIFNILTQGKNFKNYYTQIDKEPELVTTGVNNSHYQNLITTAARNNTITKKITLVNNTQEIFDYVKNNDNAIGIAYLSNVIKKTEFKMLRISFINKEGKRIPPQIVHQGFIVQEKYPYIVKHKVILREDRKNKPFWFASYLSKETRVQKYLMDSGIVPAFAKVVLVPSENQVK